MKPTVRALCAHLVPLAAAVLLFAPAPSLIADQSSAISIGAEGWFAGMVPPPGWHMLDYGLWYTADGFNDASGDEYSAGPLAGFDAEIWAAVIRPIYVSNLKIFGANQFTHLVIPIVSKDIESDVLSDSESGLGDIYFSPLLLSWHSEIWHWAGGLDVIWPTADYDERALANLGYDHITLEPAMAVTGLWPNGWTVSAKVMYDYHFDHDAIDPATGAEVDYTSQQQIHTDFQAGKLLNQQWGVGVNGYWIQGLENDEMDGTEIEDGPGAEEFALALGPGVLFKPNAKTALILKSMFEIETESRPEGVATWLRLLYSF